MKEGKEESKCNRGPAWSACGAEMALEEGARSCLLRSRHRLEQDIKPSYLMDHMISDGVLTGDEEERIRTQVSLCLRKDNRAYVSFYNALVKEAYNDLANLLHADLPRELPEAHARSSDCCTSLVQTVLSEGGVPQRPVVFVSRPELVNRVREKLYRLQKEPGWITVFGMAGSGKSVLAAEAARHHGLIEECFPGGIHWLSIGQLDKPDLLVKIQSLCFRLEQSLDSQTLHRTPNTLDEAKERLRFLMLRRYPRALLILDDIWDSTVLKAFDVHCRILLTTRNRSLTNSVSGSPLVVSLIGALLREKPDRWRYYLRQLQQKQFKRIRKSSSYDYDALDQAMAASIEVLPDEHRELYKDLTVLEKDIKVPAKVLSVLWELEPEEVEDILEEFVNKSLLFVDSHNKPYLYYLHDLQLDFLDSRHLPHRMEGREGSEEQKTEEESESAEEEETLEGGPPRAGGDVSRSSTGADERADDHPAVTSDRGDERERWRTARRREPRIGPRSGGGGGAAVFTTVHLLPRSEPSRPPAATFPRLTTGQRAPGRALDDARKSQNVEVTPALVQRPDRSPDRSPDLLGAVPVLRITASPPVAIRK
ncbi:Apoptotic protease-activating factor 1 [Liparis tanakae]|uniref:Apoptotic protease-activating factor 1 n=1 Tax=Liparis tanakae TaxID=230148 RepID=A0A4Z2FY87_9TELE|nr:Apoptotic protease-activating factor 1 [Liparis tanakae]